MTSQFDEHTLPTSFTPQSDDAYAGNGTAKICYLLSEKLQREWLRKVTPELLTKAFGKRAEGYCEPEKGYTDGEWYWEDDIGAVWGIGFRWGVPRLRGNWANTDAACLFIRFLRHETGDLLSQ